MVRIAIAGLLHETNTFAPMITTYADFAGDSPEMPHIHKPEDLLGLKGTHANVSTAGFLDVMSDQGHELVPLMLASAQPASTVTKDAFDRLTGQMIDLLREKGPFDAVYLELHGAMVTEEYEDAETEIQRRVRSVVGNVPVVATFDLHGNIPQMAVDEFDALVGYRTYPHIDVYETGVRAACLMQHLLERKPIFKAYIQLPYLIAPSTASSFTEPCISIYKKLEQIEKGDGVLSVTFMHGFLLSDIYHAGPSLFTYGTTQEAADNALDQLYDVLMDYEGGFAQRMYSPDEAVERAMKIAEWAEKPVVLADVQDNAGGGGTSDTVWVLDALVRHNARDAALGLMYDPEAAKKIHIAGVGAQIELDLGGKLMPGHSPFHGRFTVEQLFEGDFDPTGPVGRGMKANLGKMAHIRIGGVHIVVSSVRAQMNDRSFFRVVGIEPEKMKIVVVKSTNHYRAEFQPIAQEILIVEAPGAHIENPRILPYKKLREGVRLGALGPEFRK
ncbi:MAG: M81 family metallopeptidase [Chloroflexi bacterium]|nr:M81 family metallopeptidase [Chloroflexota bacterium]